MIEYDCAGQHSVCEFKVTAKLWQEESGPQHSAPPQTSHSIHLLFYAILWVLGRETGMFNLTIQANYYVGENGGGDKIYSS